MHLKRCYFRAGTAPAITLLFYIAVTLVPGDAETHNGYFNFILINFCAKGKAYEAMG